MNARSSSEPAAYGESIRTGSQPCAASAFRYPSNLCRAQAVATLPEYEGFVDLVRKGHLLDIDAARRDQLLAFADDLGLQLFVSSPDQDGVKREIKHSVSLIVVKDENLDVHLSPIHWNNTPSQGGLFGDEGPAVGMTVMEETR